MDQGSPFAPEISNTNIPVIDFSTWTSSDISASQRLATARDLVAMCHRTGFVYITNHGISSEMLDEAFNLTMKFFDLPSEKKMEAGNFEPTAALRGWSWPGLERVPPVFDDNQTPATSVPDVINYTVRNRFVLKPLFRSADKI
jgi:isopenicillin N synthase-like dioxygenase